MAHEYSAQIHEWIKDKINLAENRMREEAIDDR